MPSIDRVGSDEIGRADRSQGGRSVSSGTRSVETIVIGAGQTGLVMSRMLQDAGREHVVLDRRSTLGGGWQDRWDGFRLVSPNWTTSVPGFEYRGTDPDGYMPRDELIDHWRAYAAAIAAPIELDTEVTRLRTREDRRPGFGLVTTRGDFAAREVIVAAGPFQVPRIPPGGAGFGPSIHQVHSHHYRRPADLPDGAVLLIGTGQSGVQLAEELQAAGRTVYLSVGHCGRVPRRYRGHDVFWWLRKLIVEGPAVGAALPTVDRLPDPRMRFACNPHLSGHGGGHATNLRRLAADGIRLVGRFEAADGVRARFAPDLHANLAFADGFFAERIEALCETFIERSGLDLPPQPPEELVAIEVPEVTELDLAAEGISTVLWTSGYRLAFDWIDLPIFEDTGMPIHRRGVSDVPGLSFIGLPWQYGMGSANLIAFVQDAEHLAERWT
jgi:putative flavoprotein involved in K+ transport